MSTHAVAFKRPDEKYLKMKAVYEACRDAKLDLPEEVDRYFEYCAPAEYGELIDLDESPATKEYNDGCSHWGFDVDLSKLPEGVTHLRFYNSY